MKYVKIASSVAIGVESTNTRNRSHATIRKPEATDTATHHACMQITGYKGRLDLRQAMTNGCDGDRFTCKRPTRLRC
jgi:hypothetical protein